MKVSAWQGETLKLSLSLSILVTTGVLHLSFLSHKMANLH